MEAQARRGNIDDNGGTSGYNSGPLPKLTFAQFVQMMLTSYTTAIYVEFATTKVAHEDPVTASQDTSQKQR